MSIDLCVDLKRGHSTFQLLYTQWLDPTVQDIQSLHALLRPYPSEELMACPVSTLVNNPRHDVPECLRKC